MHTRATNRQSCNTGSICLQMPIFSLSTVVPRQCIEVEDHACTVDDLRNKAETCKRQLLEASAQAVRGDTSRSKYSTLNIEFLGL